MNKAIALAIGRAYNTNVARLVRSDRAGISYGQGGQQKIEWNVYKGAHRHRPAVWHDAGVEWIGRAVAVYNSRGQRVATVRLPRRSLDTLSDDGCTHGDAYTLIKRMKKPAGVLMVRRRYNPDGVSTGLAALIGESWEHGLDLPAILAEHERKAALARLARAVARGDRRQIRRETLLARLSSLPVTRDDAYATGACRAGVAGWCARVGIDPSIESMPAREIVRLADATGERKALAAAMLAARRALAARGVRL